MFLTSIQRRSNRPWNSYRFSTQLKDIYQIVWKGYSGAREIQAANRIMNSQMGRLIIQIMGRRNVSSILFNHLFSSNETLQLYLLYYIIFIIINEVILGVVR